MIGIVVGIVLLLDLFWCLKLGDDIGVCNVYFCVLEFVLVLILLSIIVFLVILLLFVLVMYECGVMMFVDI